jgi:hypothetical protein
VRTLVAIALLVPALALAQDAAPVLQEDPRAARFKDVERGLYVGFEAGWLGLFDTPTANRTKYQLAGASGGTAGGTAIGVLLGVDLGPRFAIALFGEGGNAKAGPNYGAFSLLAAGVDAKVAVLSWRDRNDWDRTFFYVHGRVGYARSYPQGLFGTTDLLFAGGPGIEYYTKLRHFSIGIGTDVVYVTSKPLPSRPGEQKVSALGYAVYPTLRYTF